MKRQSNALIALIAILWSVGLVSWSPRVWAESTDVGQKNLEKLFGKWDADGNGKLDKSEWRGRTPFGEVDKNKDDVVTREEVGLPADSSVQQPSPDIWNRMVQAWDGDGDGKLDKNEWRGRTPFEQVDKNKDDVVTREEVGLPADSSVQQRSPDIWNRMVQAWDGDGDGKLNKGEWRGRMPFEQMDRNGDGSITSDEMGAPSAGLQKTAPDTTAAPQESASPSGEDFQQMLKVMDMDRDGKISESEWNGSPDLFMELDQNKDHYVTADEVT